MKTLHILRVTECAAYVSETSFVYNCLVFIPPELLCDTQFCMLGVLKGKL